MDALSAIFPALILMAMAATLVVLVIGVVSMFRGGGFNARNSNRLMRMRVAFQALAILLLAIFFLVIRQ